jgi:GNAT superfamily N-acetyltransferase
MTDIVRPIAGRREFRRFVDYAYERNASDPHWIPPVRISEFDRLTPRKNPFFEHAVVQLFLAWRDGQVAGRIAAIDDRLHNEVHADNTAMFGFFEAADQQAAHALLAAAESWARQRGRAYARGPLNPSMNESAGLLVAGFDADPMLMMPHNPPAYGEYIESAGYRKVKDLFAWLYDLDRDEPSAVRRLAARARERNRLVVRPLEIREFAREAERLRAIYCGAWARNWGFVPPTADEFRRIATEMKPIFDPRCALCAEVDGRAVACAIAVPDLNQALKGTNGRLFSRALVRLVLRRRYIDQVRLLLLGVLPEYRAHGLFPLLLAELRRQLRGGPYRRAEFSWVLEDNHDINQPAEQAGARLYKRYRIYEKALV